MSEIVRAVSYTHLRAHETPERNSESADVTGCALRVVMETRNEEHIASIRQKLLDAGYVIMK